MRFADYDKTMEVPFLSGCFMFLNMKAIKEVGLFDEALPACEDYDLWLRICARYPVFYLEEPLLRKYGGHDARRDALAQTVRTRP